MKKVALITGVTREENDIECFVRSLSSNDY